MHKVYENDDLSMYFKKRYCRFCGGTLHREKFERIVHKDDPDHAAYCTVGSTYKPHGDILVIGKKYHCPSCNVSFSCDEQNDIIKAQEYHHKKLVTEEEINAAKNNKMATAVQTILKLRWLLMLPVIGGLICHFYIFNGILQARTSSKDGTKLLLASVIALIGIALAVKLALSPFDNIELIGGYKTLFMLIPSLLSYNIPMLWYINRKFKKL